MAKPIWNPVKGRYESPKPDPQLINASVGQAREGTNQGYTSIDNGWGTPVSGVNAAGKRVPFVNGQPSEVAQIDDASAAPAQRGQPQATPSPVNDEYQKRKAALGLA